MSEQPQQKWAPWWVYVVIVVGANLGKQQLLPPDANWAVNAATTAATIAGTIALITVVYRAVIARRTDDR
ncbi:MAG: hypothetical protein GEV07_23305 [Streptosporangiales bacterium]|nr:hypothetical protein [Streptosporangiales bacterium]